MSERCIGFVPCLPKGAHPGMDALGEGLRRGLMAMDLALHVAPADLRADDPIASQAEALHRLRALRVEAVVLFSLSLTGPADAMAALRGEGVRLVTIHATALPVDASLIVPNYHQGVQMAGALLAALAGRRGRPRIGVVGPPAILDDLELTDGLVAALRRRGAQLVNDPFDPQCRNLTDVAGGGRDAVEHLLREHGPIDALAVFNDESMRDALDVLGAHGLLGTLPAVSRNGTPDMVDAVRRGHVTGTFDYQLPEIGHATAALVRRVITGDVEPGALLPAPVGRMITTKNADHYRPWPDRLDPPVADPDALGPPPDRPALTETRP